VKPERVVKTMPTADEKDKIRANEVFKYEKRLAKQNQASYDRLKNKVYKKSATPAEKAKDTRQLRRLEKILGIETTPKVKKASKPVVITPKADEYGQLSLFKKGGILKYQNPAQTLQLGDLDETKMDYKAKNKDYLN